MMSLRSSPMPDLPDDLVEEILAKVPATSLKRLRSTCKKWNTLFSDRRFTKKHFDKAKKEYLCLMLKNCRLSWTSVNLHGLYDNTDPSPIEFRDELSLNKLSNNSYSDYYVKVFHCNGLLLCTNSSTTVVWNPCTGQTKWIPTKSFNTAYHESALGYVNKKSCRDYKILRFLTHETFEMEIFDFNSDSWRASGTVNPNFDLHIGAGVSVKGNTYWIASDIDYCRNAYDNEYGSYLISFDFTTERFGPRVFFPFEDYCDTDTISLYSVREERLSVLFQDNETLEIEIWMTNDITETNVMSWSMFLMIDFTLQFSNDASFLIDEENKFAIVSDRGYYVKRPHRLYIIGEDICRTVNLGDELPYDPQLFGYAPSLVQI